MSEWVQVAILAVVQGIAEFLPISSSGHLVILEEALGVRSARADLNIVLHAGTLLSILIVYRDRIARLLTSERTSIAKVLLATVPTGVIGLVIKLRFESLLEDPLLAGCLLLFTAGFLLFADRYGAKEGGSVAEMPFWKAALVGTAQGVAVLPGISRSGATIVAGMLLGLTKPEAATFSFLLAIVAICAATTLEGAELFLADHPTEAAPGLSIPLMLFGAGVSFVVGLAALAWLRRYLEHGSLKWFAYWCILMGIVVVSWNAWKASDAPTREPSHEPSAAAAATPPDAADPSAFAG